MTAPRTLTGNLTDLKAAPAGGVRLSFSRAGGVVSQYGDVVLPNPVDTATNSSGAFSITLYPGTYTGRARVSNGSLTFRFSLGETGPTDLASILEEAEIAVTPQIVIEAREILEDTEDARDAAIAAVATVPLSQEDFSTVAALLADTTLTYTAAQPKTVTVGQIVPAGGFRYQVAAPTATDHHVTTAGGVKLYVLPGADGRLASAAFGCLLPGATNDTSALQTFFATCIAENVPGRLDAGRYLIDLGSIVLDNGHVDTPFPDITTAGHEATVFVARANASAPFIAISNGTAVSDAGQFWLGGHLGGITFEKASGSVAGLTQMHGISVQGIQDATFGFFRADGIGGDTVHIKRGLFGGSNPDPYHVNRCVFSGASGWGNLGATFKNDNYRGFAFCNVIGPVFGSENEGGCLFGLGASNTFSSVAAVFCKGWTVGDQSNTTGGASNSISIGNIEIDNCQNGVDTQAMSEALTVGSCKIIHRYNTGFNAALMEGYWPRIALRVGSSFRAVRDIRFESVEDRIEAGGALADLGILADFVSAGTNLRQVYISRNVSDNAAIGVTNANFSSNFSKNSYNVFYRAPRAVVIDTTSMGNFIRARHSGAVTIKNIGFGGAGNWVAYDSLQDGATETYDTATYEYTAPGSGLYDIKATLALDLAAGERVRMGIFVNGSLFTSTFGYAVGASAQSYSVEWTGYLTVGDIVKINADQNSAADVAPGGTTGGVNDSYFAIRRL